MSDYLDPENSQLVEDSRADARREAASLAAHAAALRDPSRAPDALDEVFRSAHSLRDEAGAAGMGGLSELAGLIRDTAEALRAAGAGAAEGARALLAEAAEAAVRLARGDAHDTGALMALLAEARDGAGRKTPPRGRGRSLRVDSARIDAAASAVMEVMRTASVLARSADKAAVGLEEEPARAAVELRDSAFACARSVGELRDAMARIRLVPIAGVFRSVGRRLGGSAALEAEGGRTEIDAGLAGELPKVLARYAGLRGGDVRKRGKSAAKFALSARAEADSVIVLLSGGRSARPALERGLRREIGEWLAKVGGHLGAGKGLELHLPRTPGVARCLLVRAGEILCAIPGAAVVECLAVRGGGVERGGRKIPTVRLDRLFSPSAPRAGAGRMERAAVVIRSGARLAAVIADAHVGVEDVTVELPVKAPPAAGRNACVAGVGASENGTPVRILDVQRLVARAHGKKQGEEPA
jgi:chemotaxis protein histidine kinase CheA